METSKLRLDYNDLYPDGALAGFVKEFVFFLDVECKDAFLALIKYRNRVWLGTAWCFLLIAAVTKNVRLLM